MSAAATFADPRPVGRRVQYPETEDIINQFQHVLKRVHAFEQSAPELKPQPINKHRLGESLARIEKRAEEARCQFQILNESLAADAIHQDNILFSKASHASAMLYTDDQLTNDLRILENDIRHFVEKIIHLKETRSSSIACENARLAERKLRLIENDLVHARQRISEAERQYRQVKNEFEHCAKGNRLQIIVMKSMEQDMSKIRRSIHNQVDCLTQTRAEIQRSRADLEGLQAAAAKQVVQFNRDWDCLKTFEEENPAIQRRFEIFDDIRRLHEDSTRAQRAVAKKLDALQVQVQVDIETNKAKIRQLLKELDQAQGVLSQICHATGLQSINDVRDHFLKAEERQFDLVTEIESLSRIRFDLERDLQHNGAEGSKVGPEVIATDRSDELCAQIDRHERQICELQAKHDDIVQQLDKVAAFLSDYQTSDADIGLERGLAALETHIFNMIEMAAAPQLPPSLATGRASGPYFNILSTLHVEDDYQHGERIHNADDAGRQFIDALCDQYRRRSVTLHRNETLLEAMFAARRFSVASSVQSATDNPI